MDGTRPADRAATSTRNTTARLAAHVSQPWRFPRPYEHAIVHVVMVGGVTRTDIVVKNKEALFGANDVPRDTIFPARLCVRGVGGAGRATADRDARRRDQRLCGT